MPRKKRSCSANSANASKRWKTEDIADSKKISTEKESLRLSQMNVFEPEKVMPEVEIPQYMIVDFNQIKKLFANVLCNSCKQTEIDLVDVKNNGFCHQLKVQCKSCSSIQSEIATSKTVDLNDHKPFDVNVRVVQSFLNFAKGFATLETFCMHLNLKIMSSRTFNLCKRLILSSSTTATEKSLIEIHKKVKAEYGSSTDSSVVDIGVSFDGTWLTRGHSSKIGVACVINLLTGYIIDYKVMSKRCTWCEQTGAMLGKDSAEFLVWYEGHRSECSINHIGSSGGMEVEAAIQLWRRSQSKGFRYTTILSDGDSKVFQTLTDENIYGNEITISKEECVNHVSKRLGTALRKAVKDWRTKGVTLGGKKHGSLKESTIKKLTRYYGNAIRRNKGDVQGMKSAILGTLLHCISTDKKPQHSKCPKGKDSWCFYQSAIASNIKPGAHKDNVKTPLNEAHLAKVMPIYQRLTSDELLGRCVRCSTQNSNESFHSLVWSKCSKESCASLERVQIAVSDSVSEFNNGTFASIQNNLQQNNMYMNVHSKYIAKNRDYRRQYLRRIRTTTAYRTAQRKIKIAIFQKRKAEKKKDLLYNPGGF